MKKILTLLAVIVTFCTTYGAVHFVAPTGNDNNFGNLAYPWKTWQKGFAALRAGDTLFIRGGVYKPSEPTTITIWSSTLYCGVAISNVNGTASQNITVKAYKDERPILDCSNITSSGSRIGIVLNNCDYWNLIGLEECYAVQISGYGAAGIWMHDCNNCRLERVVTHHNGGSGVRIIQDCEGNLLYNCDSYANNDNFTGGENADGFEIANTTFRAGNPRINTMRGCRAWYNSDDGVDLFRNDGTMIMDSCWFWSHGYVYNSQTLMVDGDGNGLKLGTTTSTDGSEFQRTITNCLVFLNSGRGIEQNAANVKMYIYNNTVYKNAQVGIKFYSFNLANVFKNNISFLNTGGNWEGTHTNAIIENNTYHSSWQPTGPVASEEDFVSLDTAGMAGPRGPNGRLPLLKFLRLKPESDLVDTGSNVGKAFIGKAPDLGAFEYQAGLPLKVKDHLVTINFNVYPNPVIDEFIIDLPSTDKPLHFEILNMSGQVMYDGYINGKAIVPANRLAPGIYSVRIGNEPARKIIKL